MNQNTFTVDKDNLKVIITRTFDAPRELVFKAFTTPELIEKWWGPKEFETKVEIHEFKVGGKWRYLNTEKDGSVSAFRGEFKEIDEPNKIVFTFEFEPMAGHILTETVTFEEKDGKTYITDTSHYPNLADLEGMVSMGMEWGSTMSMNQLAELLATLS